MDYSRNKEKPARYHRINKWFIIAIIGLNTIIVGIIFIFLSLTPLSNYYHKYIVLIYILSDYLYLNSQYGFDSFETLFVFFSSMVYNSHKNFISTTLIIGILLCVTGEIVNILGLFLDNKLRREYAVS